MKTAVFRSPYFVMVVVLFMYAIKVVAKLSIGAYVHSPVIMGDGYHNVADVLEALIVVVVISYARMSYGDEYPLGRSNIESIFKFGVGIALCYTAFQLCVRCGVELVAYVPSFDTWLRAHVALPHHELLRMGAQYFWYVAGVTGLSALTSWGVGRYQIIVGQNAGCGSLKTDGIETLNDGKIEGVTCVGVLSEYFFHISCIEYPLGLYVAYLVFHAGKELIGEAWGALLQRSIGKAHEVAIRDITTRTCGVLDLAELKAFCVGERVVCIMKVITRLSHTTNVDIKHALADNVAEYLETHGFDTHQFFIRFDHPDAHERRVAYAVFHGVRGSFVAESLHDATHVRICDEEYEEIVRWDDEAISGIIPEEILALLLRKRVRILYVYGDEPDRAIFQDAGIEVKQTISSVLDVLGIA
ncbi:MAG: cation transporter [Patescibacteria group bacterium]|nr:cation transporter [Patescibacteria group bacterium]MDE2438165.1 cation transporter [Patescibacteria group bacterium]